MQVPRLPLVIATGRPRHSGRSCCSMDAKKAFMSTSAIARGQTAWWWSVSGSPVRGMLLEAGIGGSLCAFVAGSWPAEYCDYIQYSAIKFYLQFMRIAAGR